MDTGDMQRKLSVWAEQDKNHRFFDLYHLLYDRDWLRLAHDHVAQNAGSVTAGCDGITMQLFDKDLEGNLQRLARELKSETFAPCPVRRVYIPKANGKRRPLGIPAIRDRIVQEALRMVLEPIYEADFRPSSFGFRPNRCTMDALKCITWSTQERKKFFWVIEGDITAYFDTINHRRLLKRLRRRIKDAKLLRLIGKFLRAGVMEGKLFRDTTSGTPQGGIVSPLLANIYLHELDKYMERYTGLSRLEKARRRPRGMANYVYVRYADDFVVLCNGTKAQAEALREELSGFLNTQLRLELSQEKTTITHLNEGFEFLGVKIQRRRGRVGMSTHLRIPKGAVDRLRKRIIAATTPASHRDSVHTKILALNQHLSGWCRYYQHTANAAREFAKLNPVVFWRMAHWLGRKFRIMMPEVMRRYRWGNTFATGEAELHLPSAFPTSPYCKRFLKPNPYTTQDRRLAREELLTETRWTGYEARPGMADLRPLILTRDEFTCQRCGAPVMPHTAEIDHIRPVRRFKRPVEANTSANLRTLCLPCHQRKTQDDRQMESGVR
jgi:RNA-directed DNA polymerase